MKNSTVFIIIIIAFVSKCVIAGIVELNNDEVYYWTYAQKLQWSYFDHPPMIAVVLKLFSLNLLFDNEIMLRLGPIICGTISTLLIFLLGKKIGNQHTGTIAMLLFLAAPYCNIIAGLLVIPDAPMLVFWLCSILLMAEVIQNKQSPNKANTKLLLLGVSIGLCILSKIHGVFLWFGFIGFTVLYKRELFRNRYFYLSMFISLLLVLPILFWNISNDFITYKYQGNRIGLGTIQWDSFFREFFGEIAYSNPINYFLMIATFWAIIKRKQTIEPDSRRLFLFLSLPLILSVLAISLFRDTLPHWTGPSFATLLPLTAAYINRFRPDYSFRKFPYSVKFALGLTFSLLVISICLIKWLPVNIGSKNNQELGKHDVTLDMNGWKEFGIQLDSLHHQDIETGIMKQKTFLISDYWFPAAHIDYYVARRYRMPFLAVGDLTGIHHYAWLNTIRPALIKGDDAYFINVSNFYNPPKKSLSDQFRTISDTATITQYRSGVAVRNFFIYRLKNYRGNIPISGILNY